MTGSKRSVEPGGLRQAVADLISAGAEVDSLCDTSGQSMELLEARGAIHDALVVLANSDVSRNNDSGSVCAMACT